MSEKIYKSACPYNCFDCCSFNVYVKNGKVVKITANPEADFTGGFICKKGQAHVTRMYSPKRLRYPLLKTARGWQRISWPAAYELIAEKINAAKKQYGPTALGVYIGDGGAGILKGVAKIFLAHLGGYTDFTGSICWGAGIEATKRDFGAALSHHPDDIANAKTIVLWGRNPLETNLHLVPYLKKAQQKGSKIYLVDPRVSASSKIADIHLKIKPGADWALAAACAHYCLRNHKVEHNFLHQHLADPSGILPYLESLSPTDYRHLLEAAGVSADMVAELAQDLYHGPSSCYLGYGPQQYKSGGLNIRAINLLWAITGNIGIKGGGVNYANHVNIGLFDFSFAQPKTAPQIREMQLGNFAAEIHSASPPLQLLFISGANPAVQLPDSANVKRALAEIPFKVCLEHFLTDTANLCELVLPVTYFTEEEDIIISNMWNSSLKYVNKCVKPLAECKAEFTIFQELAKLLGLSQYPTSSAREWLKKATTKLATYGLNFTTLLQQGYLDSPLQKQVPWNDRQFATPDGKFQAFDKEELRQKLTDYKANSANEQDKIKLLTVHWRDQINSQLPFPLPQLDRPLLYLHPAAAEKFGVTDGSRALATANGNSLEVIVVVTDKASPFAAHMRQGYCNNTGGPVNILTPAGITDIGNQAIFNETSIMLLPLTAADTPWP
ncbi:MAG: molybdopterin-dependent oxidoreductase [Firmicutes bacterium]|nr:molybdopterin-dependent oxidoreductase [Bacillota bacterium]